MRAARAATTRDSRWQPIAAPPRPVGTPFFSLGRMNSLALALLAAVAMAATYGLFRIEIGDRRDHQVIVWSTCGMLVCLAMLMLLIGRYLTQRCLRHIEDQLRCLAREDRIDPLEGPVPEELQATLSALEDYVQRVCTRTDRLRVQKKELDLQMRTAQAERRHTEAIIFSISDAVLVIDTFGELVLANHAAEVLFSFRLADVRHRPIERIIQDPAVSNMIKEARTSDQSAPRTANGETDQSPQEGPAKPPSGSEQCLTACARSSGPQSAIRPINCRQVEYSQLRHGKLQTFTITLSPVHETDGKSRGVVAIFHDITRERELAQIKTDFVSAVSHELRTPLSSIKAYAEMLVDGEAADDRTRNDFYKIIDSETDRLQRLIGKVLDISRIESGVMAIHRAHVRVHEVIREVLDMVAPQAREKQIQLESDFGGELPALSADRDLLYQAVQNVVSNAIKYTPQGGTVHIRTAIDDSRGHFTVAVCDSGMGIRQEDLPRIFDKFYRSREGAAVAKGTGLGLNLVKQIVETVHGGSIDVTSEHAVGTTFVLRFPLYGIH